MRGTSKDWCTSGAGPRAELGGTGHLLSGGAALDVQDSESDSAKEDTVVLGPLTHAQGLSLHVLCVFVL